MASLEDSLRRAEFPLTERATYLDALKWAVHLLRTPEMDHKAAGLEGLRVWAEEMTQEKYFPLGEADIIDQRYVSAAINMTMLRDHCEAEAFLRQAVKDVPDFQPELTEAAGYYSEVKQIRNNYRELAVTLRQAIRAWRSSH